MNPRKAPPISTRQPASQSLFAPSGERKYLNADERQRFITAVTEYEKQPRLLCLTLLYSGCRLSEALALSRSSVQWHDEALLIRSLKKRDVVSFRRVPVPHQLMVDICKLAVDRSDNAPMFDARRTVAWQWVKDGMAAANIEGARATPRGLRHTFGTHAVASGVPLNLIQRWLGHAKIETTAIYTDLQGPEELEMARRMWP